MNLEVFKNLNILYVEDEIEVSKELIHNLSFFVNEVYYCENGKEGLSFFKINEKEIDIIITDVLMPILDGKEMVDEIKILNKKIPIIYTSAFNDIEFLEYTKGQENIKNVSKPIDLEKLFNCIRNLISK